MEDIGYGMLSGNFVTGEEVTVRRPEANPPHALEKLVGYNNLGTWRAFPDRLRELDWVAEQIRLNIEGRRTGTGRNSCHFA